VGVRQVFPHRDARDARAAQASEGAARNDAEIDQRFAELRADLIVALLDLERVAALRALLGARDSKYDELAQIVETEINAGRPVLFRLAEIDVERSDVARALADLDAEADQIRARLADLVGEAAASPAPPLSLRAWSGEADAFHAVRVARAGVSVAETGIDQAEAAWRPNWGVQLMYQQRDAPGDDWVSATASFTVPFWADRSQAPALREAEANREAARSRYAAAARRAAARYQALEATRTAAEAAATILEQKIDAIREQIAAQLITYESGAGDYSPILDGEIAVLRLEGQIVDEQARRDRAVAGMNALLVEP
jgi:outer membrane protein TolC